MSGPTDVGVGDPTPFLHSDTVYFCCVDAWGNGCSMINSNYTGFGSGIVPEGCGFTLQNRGCNFSLNKGHPNSVAPRKRPYHTIIPCLMTRESDSSLFATLGVMGGFMQPQGHFQVVRNLIDFGMDAQSALDAPRWYLDGVGKDQSSRSVFRSAVLLEDGYGGTWDQFGATGSIETIIDRGERCADQLRDMGHAVGDIVRGEGRGLFGRGQVIVRDKHGVLCGGSDPRADGCAMPLV